MSEQGDYQLDPFDEHGTLDLAEELAPEPRPRWPWFVALALILAILGAWGYWKFFAGPAAPAPSEPPAPALEAPAAEPVTQEAVDLPALTESDGWLRDVVGQLSEHPQLVTWLLNEDLIRRFVATVDNLAEGSSPRPHVRFLKPSGEFRVTESGDRLRIDPASYERYATLVAVVTSLHIDGTAQVYRNVKPLLDEAYRDLGYPDGDFDEVASRALAVLFDTPTPSDLEVERYASSYKYADPRLEGLSDAQKHFLRLGPDNLRAVQRHVRAIAQRAGLATQ
jgi:hypothetical protein